jgi:hypothetical protein
MGVARLEVSLSGIAIITAFHGRILPHPRGTGGHGTLAV